MLANLEFFPYTCPHCSKVRNAVEVARELPEQVLLLTRAGYIARRRKRVAGPGRPKLARCPGCSQEMPTEELRNHRIDCVRRELERLRGMPVWLSPKDPDPWPDFHLKQIFEDKVEFEKHSNHDCVTIDLRKIADIAISRDDGRGYVNVLGRIVWHDDIKRWRWYFLPTAPVGRPPRPTGGTQA
jgi:hypothetical protein